LAELVWLIKKKKKKERNIPPMNESQIKYLSRINLEAIKAISHS
jgi:hypothetical protein